MYDFQESFDLEDQLLQISSYFYSPLVDLDNNYVQTNLFAAPNNNHHHLPVAPGGGKKRKRSPTNNDDKKNIVKKISHREIEKQRRQEMAKLYASLKSLLPLEYVKGKRSISDHMDEAVNYINNLQKNISHLLSKKMISFTENPNFSSSSFSNINAESCSDRRLLSSTVTINPCGNGLEILIRLNRKDEVIFPISKMMSKLFGEGLNVTSYLSTKTHDDATLYRFISEIEEGVVDRCDNAGASFSILIAATFDNKLSQDLYITSLHRPWNPVLRMSCSNLRLYKPFLRLTELALVKFVGLWVLVLWSWVLDRALG